jgi:hypothetical protein
MSELLTDLTVKLVGNAVILEYEVVTTGQMLNDDERGYWSRESKALEAFLNGDGALFSVAGDEGARASHARGELMSSALGITGIVFAIMFVIGLVLARLNFF